MAVGGGCNWNNPGEPVGPGKKGVNVMQGIEELDREYNELKGRASELRSFL